MPGSPIANARARDDVGVSGMKARSVTCVGYGDPADPHVWSGTPAAVVAALKEAGCSVATVNSLTPRRLVKLGQLAVNALSYGNLDFRRGPFARARAAARARRRIDAAGNDHILHFSVNHLPLARIQPRERHYLYLDFTYDQRLGLESGRQMRRFERVVDNLDRAAYRQIDHFFAVSRSVARNLAERYGIAADRITIVGTGLGAGFLRAEAAEKDYANGEILFSSKLIDIWALKGGPLLLDAFALARRQNPALHLSLVGHEGYKKLAAGVPGVTAYGYVSWDELIGLFQRGALFAMPAPQEPWGLVYLEALACGMPILGLDRFAFPEISGNGEFGFVCPEATSESVAATIMGAMSAPARLAEMGARGRSYVRENFSWPRTAGKMLDVMFAPAPRR